MIRYAPTNKSSSHPDAMVTPRHTESSANVRSLVSPFTILRQGWGDESLDSTWTETTGCWLRVVRLGDDLAAGCAPRFFEVSRFERDEK